MARRSYDQHCGLAHALDLIGERWTPLIVRDLALGPRRFSDLLHGLPGMGTSLLSERLRRLEEIGAVHRVVAELPERGVRYALTDDGRELARALAPVAAWGARMLGPIGDKTFRPEWLMFMFHALFRAREAAGVHDCYEFCVEGEDVWVAVDDGAIAVSTDKPREPDFVLTLDVPTLAALGAGRMTPEEAIESGAATFEGDPAAGWRALRLLGSEDYAQRA